MAEAGQELGVMQLSDAQTALMRFLHERFPTAYRETGEVVQPRAKY